MLSVAVTPELCTRCGRCEVACALTRSGGSRGAGSLVRVGDGTRPTLGICRHCERAPCVEACVAGAIRADPESGLVRIDGDRCVGCWGCVMECPFAAIEMVEAPGRGWKAQKCDGCAGTLDPACAAWCPTGALRVRPGPAGMSGAARRARVTRVFLRAGTGGRRS